MNNFHMKLIGHAPMVYSILRLTYSPNDTYEGPNNLIGYDSLAEIDYVKAVYKKKQDKIDAATAKQEANTRRLEQEAQRAQAQAVAQQRAIQAETERLRVEAEENARIFAEQEAAKEEAFRAEQTRILKETAPVEQSGKDTIIKTKVETGIAQSSNEPIGLQSHSVSGGATIGIGAKDSGIGGIGFVSTVGTESMLGFDV